MKAISEKAKISGLLVQKVEIGDPGDFSDCETEAETIDRMIEVLCAERPEAQAHFTAEDRAKLLEMMAQVGEFVAACKARPVNVTPRDGYSGRMLELQRRGNGRSR